MRVWERTLLRLTDGVRSSMSWDEYQSWMSSLGLLTQTMGGGRGDEEPPPPTFEGYARQIFGANPVVFAAERIRTAVFAQGRFAWRDDQDGKFTGSDRSLELLRRPGPGETSAKLLTRMLLHADLAGNAYPRRIGRSRVTLLRPDWVTIVLGSNEADPGDEWMAADAEFVGVVYEPPGGQRKLFLPGEVGHFAPMPDPLSNYRGMSWLTPVVREVRGDQQAIEHKLKFFDQGATPNMVIKFDPAVELAKVKAFKELVEDDHDGGLRDAYKTLYLGGGADATVVGANFEQLDFARTIGKAETRILMAAGVHPTLAGASEGMQGASLNAGNFAQTRRIFSDVHLQDLWTEAAASLEAILPGRPRGKSLAIDGSNIPFLQEDQKDAAQIQQLQATAIVTLVRDGWDGDAAVSFVMGNDLSQLIGAHTGLVSVQLQKPGEESNDE